MDEENVRASTNFPLVSYGAAVANAEGVNPADLGSTNLQMLQEAISRCAVPLVHQMIQQNPKVIHEKGWHGQTALHRACLVGDWSITYLLIEAGADVNAPNEFDETPVHYACKRGAASVVHLLVQRGGNLEAVDKNGMDVGHHTAQTGSVYVLKYLEMNGVKFQSVNKKLQSPLHIACQYGHVDAFKFLLKNARSDLQQADADGNTPLHIAARQGHGFLCWLILTMVGSPLLHKQNREGLNPVELTKHGDKIGHREIRPIMEWMAKKDSNFKLVGPIFAWYWTLFLPAIYYAVMVIIAMFLLPSYQGPCVFVGLLGLLRILLAHTHRINHVCRWPNPVYAGTFAAGVTHTTLVYLILILPHTKVYLIFSGLCLLGLGFMFYFYRVVLKEDPGTVKTTLRNKESGRYMTLLDLCVPPNKIDLYCVVCEVVRGSTTKHCKLCERCFEHMDHHCLFLLTCVAKHNHRLFVRFILYVLFVMILFFVNVYLYFGIVYSDLTLKDLCIEVFWHNGWLLSMMALNLASVVWGVNLLRFQLHVVSKGSTTIFMGKQESVLTQSERFMNMLYFVIGKEPYMKDPILCAEQI